MKLQDNKCCLCDTRLDDDNSCLDHCHSTGAIRGVLCRNCNGIEGKVYNLARRAKRLYTVTRWLERLLAYYHQHETSPSGVWHPTYKTTDEKRLARNAKARKARAKAKRT